MLGCYSFFFFFSLVFFSLFFLLLLFLTSIIFLVCVWVCFVFSCFVLDKRANRPVSQLGSHLTIKILWVAYCILIYSLPLWMFCMRPNDNDADADDDDDCEFHLWSGAPFYYIFPSAWKIQSYKKKTYRHVHTSEI